MSYLVHLDKNKESEILEKYESKVYKTILFYNSNSELTESLLALQYYFS